jgi:hypothetical protein
MATDVEYILQLNKHDARDRGGIAVGQCPECFSLVAKEFLPYHERWHLNGEGPQPCLNQIQDNTT